MLQGTKFTLHFPSMLCGPSCGYSSQLFTVAGYKNCDLFDEKEQTEVMFDPEYAVTEWSKSFHPTAWSQLTVRDGEKESVEIEMVKRCVQTRLEQKRKGPDEWMVGTRHLLLDDCVLEGKSSPDAMVQDGRYRYYLTRTSGSEVELKASSLSELGQVIKAGLCIEASFNRGKGEVGMDAYQVRRWQGCHHHIALSLISVWFRIGETHRGQQLTLASTLLQVRYGLILLPLELFCTSRLKPPVAKSIVN